MQLANDTEKLEDDTTHSIIYAVLAVVYLPMDTHKYTFFFCYFPNNCNFFVFGHTNLALYAHATGYRFP